MVLSTSTALHSARQLARQLASHLARRFLAACVPAALLASAANAQLVEPSAALPASAFKGYKPYTDESTGNWKAANDTTARIGGWREYAKQVQGMDSKLEATPTPAAKAGQAVPEPVNKAKP